MSHPRIEEVEESDVEMSDPSEGDIDDFVESDILRSRSGDNSNNAPNAFASKSFPIRQPPAAGPGSAKSHILNPAHIPTVSSGPPGSSGGAGGPIPTTADRKAYAAFQCLYPVYFDATRTRAEGRRIPRELAVASPLAREIVNACRDLRLQTVFEPDKMHPKDWANPGRVKVQLKKRENTAPGSGAGSGAAAGVKNKHQLYILIAQHLRNSPASERSPALWERLPGVPAPDNNKPYPKPAVPRGWKVGEFLPYYSPAMTGGGISENLFSDMMKEMGGGGDMASLLAGAGAGGGGASGNASEDGGGKKKKKGKGKA